MQSVYSSAAHAGIRGVSPPMPQSPTTKIARARKNHMTNTLIETITGDRLDLPGLFQAVDITSG